MVDIFKTLEKELPGYINQIKNSNSEAKIIHEFTSFIYKVFDVEAKELDFEVSVKSDVRKVKGRMDAVFGDIILEFKKKLKDVQVLKTAKDELEKYFQSLYEKDPKIKYLGIATDGLNFRVYQPIIENNQISKLEQINEINLDQSMPEIVFNWFDSYFFSSKKITPTSEHLKQSFGLNSPTYAVARQELIELFDKVKDNRSIKTKYGNWARFLEIVYGDKPNEINLFIAHTYLSTFAKLLVYMKLTSNNQFRNYDILPILYGNIFSQLGIRNFVEDDFFTWTMFVTIRKQSSKMFEKILRDLEIYDLDKMDEDILKELYQEMIRDEVKKQLGEFYSPDWLAEKMIEDVLSENPKQSILDPSCGSGTFLFKAILYKIKKLRDVGIKDSEILSHILENVIGFDIHPLAALIAKTNYLLALREIISTRNGPITIPVYLSDSLKIPEKKMEVLNSTHTFEFSTEILDKKFVFPESFVDNILKMDDVIEKMKIHGHDLEEKIGIITESSYKIDLNEVSKNIKQSFERSISNIKDQNEKEIMMKNIQTLFELIKDNADSIWPYVLRNIYKPLAVAHKKVDIVIGNPPWLALGKMHNLTYRQFLKEESTKLGLVGNVNNLPNIELSTLFLYHCSNEYVKDNGKISFVMPRSVLVSSQHVDFLKFKNPKNKLYEILDLKEVSPLFKVPSCVLSIQKSKNTSYPVTKITYHGKLSKFNEQLTEANKLLNIKKEKYSPVNRDFEDSFYNDKFERGADLTPRCFWFIEIIKNSMLGFNPENPFVKSEFNSSAKEPWKINVEGNINQKFLFNTILATDLIPFGIKKRKLIFLPITSDKIKIITSENMSDKGTRDYLDNIEQIYQGKKDNSIYNAINFRNKLTNQNMKFKFKVLYNSSGTYIASTVTETKRTKQNEGGLPIETNGFVTDVTTYYYETNDEVEAHYLVACLNSRILNNLIKPLQSEGSFGPRDIHKLPLKFPIPKFDSTNNEHKKLMALSKICAKKVEEKIKKINFISTGKIRNVIRENLKEELDQIDNIVKKLLEVY